METILTQVTTLVRHVFNSLENGAYCCLLSNLWSPCWGCHSGSKPSRKLCLLSPLKWERIGLNLKEAIVCISSRKTAWCILPQHPSMQATRTRLGPSTYINSQYDWQPSNMLKMKHAAPLLPNKWFLPSTSVLKTLIEPGSAKPCKIAFVGRT